MIEHDPSTVEEGWEVCGIDGAKVGSVKSSEQGAIVVETGSILKRQVRVPASFIEGIAQERVTLTIPSDQVEAMGWDTPQEDRPMTDEDGRQAPASARIGTSEPDTSEPVATTAGSQPGWVDRAAETGTRERAGSTSVAAQATEPTGDETAPVARPADALNDPSATRPAAADTTTMTGAGYGAGLGVSSAGGMAARTGPDAQDDRAGGSGRAGTSDLAPPAETQERPTPG